jgi:membrane associated rhomboid family serine protease
MHYQLQSKQGDLSFKPQYFTEAIKILIAINAILFFFRFVAQSQLDLAQVFGLSASSVWPMVWQPVTYMFIHGDFFHVFMNMFVLWMFGSELESIWGRQEFLKYYFTTGIGSGLVWLTFNIGNPFTVLIGASGAIYGILLAYGLMFPNRKISIYFLFPVKVKYFVIFLGTMAFVSSIGTSGSNISHLTHLSGMVMGYLYLKSPWTLPKVRLLVNFKLAEIRYKKEGKKEARKLNRQQTVDFLLDKINQVGYDELTEDEKDELYINSRHLGKDIDKD